MDDIDQFKSTNISSSNLIAHPKINQTIDYGVTSRNNGSLMTLNHKNSSIANISVSNSDKRKDFHSQRPLKTLNA